MLGRTFLSVGISLSLALLASCSSNEEKQRPGGIQTGGSPTVPPNPVEMGGSGSMVQDGTVTGTVEMWTNDLFGQTTGFTSPSDIFVLSADGGDSVNSRFDGADFEVEGDVDGTRWVQVRPINDRSTIPTLTRLDLSSGEVTLPIMQASVLDEMILSITTNTELDDNAAQVVIHVVDLTGAGVMGVEATTQASGPGLITYRQEDGAWLDVDVETNQPGLIFIPNIDAPVFPGQDIQVILSGTIDGTELDVRIVSGSVTFLTVVVP